MPRADYTETPAELATLGNAMRSLREAKGLKQIELATAAGVAESQVSDIERGKNNPGWLLLARLLDGLGVDIAEFASAYAQAERRSE